MPGIDHEVLLESSALTQRPGLLSIVPAGEQQRYFQRGDRELTMLLNCARWCLGLGIKRVSAH